MAAAGAYVAHRRVFGIEQRECWPPPPDAVTAAGAQAATEAFAGTHANDAALPFAWSTAATLEPWAEGVNFFPRIFADVEAARSSVHILMFGWREGEVGTRMAALLERKLADGVQVRVIVDNMGSKPHGAAKAMYAGLAAAGAEIQVHDFRDNPGRVDHRKLYVIDGAVAWTGGAGIEDHFENGQFHDVMVRVTGDVVRQAQAAFLTSFRGHGGTLPADLSHLFPAPADPGATPVALAQVIPGGFVAAPEAIREQIENARERLDVMNPYFTDATWSSGSSPPRAAASACGSSCPRPRTTTSRPPRSSIATASCARPARRCGRCPTWSSTRRSSWPTTPSASAPSTSTRGRSTATRRS